MQGGMISACYEFSLPKIILFSIVQDYMYPLYIHQKEFLVLFLELSGMSFLPKGIYLQFARWTHLSWPCALFVPSLLLQHLVSLFGKNTLWIFHKSMLSLWEVVQSMFSVFWFCLGFF